MKVYPSERTTAKLVQLETGTLEGHVLFTKYNPLPTFSTAIYSSPLKQTKQTK